MRMISLWQHQTQFDLPALEYFVVLIYDETRG